MLMYSLLHLHHKSVTYSKGETEHEGTGSILRLPPSALGVRLWKMPNPPFGPSAVYFTNFWCIVRISTGLNTQEDFPSPPPSSPPPSSKVLRIVVPGKSKASLSNEQCQVSL